MSSLIKRFLAPLIERDLTNHPSAQSYFGVKIVDDCLHKSNFFAVIKKSLEYLKQNDPRRARILQSLDESRNLGHPIY